MPSFFGSSFKLESVAQVAPATIRVRFTQPPKAVSAGASNDALNPANYSLTGPSANLVSNCGTVFGDDQSIDLFLATTLTTGTWTVTVAGTVVAYDTTTLIVAPTALSFAVTLTTMESAINPGTTNDDAAKVLRKHLNPALKGDAWDALIAAIATGEQKNWDNAKLAFDQLFKSSASGIYLERLAADDGLTKPKNIGMTDELFRQYSIKTTNNKLVENALLEILEVFYGSDAVRASADSSVAQPYVFQEGDDLTVLLDEQDSVTVVFTQDDFAILGRADADEVAAAITRAFRFSELTAFAVAVTDPETGSTKVRIYSGSLGLSSSVRITGGKAQNVLKFPDPVAGALTGLPTWTVTYLPASGRVRFTASTFFDASKLLIGDYVNIYGTQFSAVNQGTYPIVYVYWTPGSQYFEVENNFGVSEGPIVQTAATDLAFYRPTRKTIHTTPSRAVVISSLNDEIDVVLPATSQAVSRTEKTAAYGQVNGSIAISTLERVSGTVSVTTGSAHGLSVGDQVMIDGVYGTPTTPSTSVGTYASFLNQLSDYSLASIWSNSFTTSAREIANRGGVAVKLPDGRVWFGYGNYNSGGAYTAATQWSLFKPISMATLGSGAKQLNFDVQRRTSGTTTVPVNLNNVAASAGTSALFQYNNVVITGGDTGTGGSVIGDPVATTYVYTPDASGGTIAAGPVMGQARSAHIQQTTLTNGAFVVAGGMEVNNRAGVTTERWVVGTNWLTKGSMKEPRVQAASLILKYGPHRDKILAIGGRSLSQGHPKESDTLGLWHMDLSGSNTDSSGNGYDMTDAGAVTKPNCMSSLGRQYDGSAAGGSSRASGDAAFLNLFQAGNYTVEGYFNLQSNTSQGPFVAYSTTHDGNAATNVQFYFGTSVLSASRLEFYCETGANVRQTWTSSAPILSSLPYVFNHFAITCTPSVSFPGKFSFYVYVNGVQVEPIAGTGPTIDNITPPTGGSSSRLFFAECRSNAGTWVLNNSGQLDDIRISNTAHTKQQVWDAYQRSIGIFHYEDACRIGPVAGTCELFDEPGAFSWAYTGRMANPRFGASAVELPDGRVLVVGGIGPGPGSTTASGAAITPVLEAEIWNPVTQAWQPAGRLAFGRDNAVVAYIASTNKVVVSGGSYSSTTEIFDPDTVKWSLGPALFPALSPGGLGVQTTIGGEDVVVFAGGKNPATGNTRSSMYVYIQNADQFFAGGLSGMFTVTNVGSSTSFKYKTPEKQYTLLGSTTGTATAVKAAASTIAGPFIFSPDDGVAVTASKSTSTMDLAEGQQYSFVDVADATQFPDQEGWLVFSFGYSNQVAPVRYFGRLSSTRLSLDFTFKFPATVKSGSTVTLLEKKGPYVPENPAEVGSCYITASPAGRVAASQAIDESVGAGITVDKTITYPGDRGLGGEGLPAEGNYKLSDKVVVWGSDDLDAEVEALREE